jgi:hypothetical protein
MAKRDGVAPSASTTQLANVFLGTSIGAQIDLGLSDKEIIAKCELLLQRARASIADPQIVSDLNGLVADMQKK